MPAPQADRLDDLEDNILYLDWLHRMQDLFYPVDDHTRDVPTVNDYAVLIFALFQQQRLTCVPKTIRENRHFPDHAGRPCLQATSEDALRVTQNLLRESYASLPSRLTRFAATQYKIKRWTASTMQPSTHHRHRSITRG
jgi:hypothetical protein